MSFKDAQYCRFVLDGVAAELTPAQLLSTVMTPPPADSEKVLGELSDESVDIYPFAPELQFEKAAEYLEKADSAKGIPLPYSGTCTILKIAECLIDTLWRQGNFKLDDLQLTAKYRWNSSGIGKLSSFYRSVEEGVRYIYDLGITVKRMSVEDGEPEMDFATGFSGASRIVPDRLVPQQDSWIIYLPFEGASPKLGGSSLSGALGFGGVPPQTGDADYFMDCFEVVREFATDGILLSAATVGKGGLYKALHSLCRDGQGAETSIGGILKAYEGSSPVDVLFSEIPGAVIQISDCDFDYVDAELLLQDVPYFPLGHPSKGKEVSISASEKSDIRTILESLMKSAA